VTFELSEFSVYKPKLETKFTGWDKVTGDLEFVPLYALKTRVHCNHLLVDGILSVGTKRRSIQAAPFSVLSIEGYGDSTCPSVIGNLWLQTTQAGAKDVWYHLGKPANEYARYHQPFCWIADFGKHFVDYLLEHPTVELRNFQSDFYQWVQQYYGSTAEVSNWSRQYRSSDFRAAAVAYMEYLWKEATNISDDLRNRFLWREIDHKALSAVPPQLTLANTNSDGNQMTIVTPFVYECFKNIYFASVLKPLSCTNPRVLRAQEDRKATLGFITGPPTLKSFETLRLLNFKPQAIQPGDVVCVPRDMETKWKDKAEIWLGK